MAWADLADRALVATQSVLGEAATYTRATDGSVHALTRVIFDEDALLVSEELGVPVRSGRPAISVRLADLGFTPAQGDHVEVRSVRHKVVDTVPDGQGGSVIVLHKL